MWTLNPRRPPKRSKRDPNNHLGSVQDVAFGPKDGNEGNLPSAVETSQKGKGKITESSHRPDVDTNVDIPAEDRRTLKIGMTASQHHACKNQRLASLEEDLAHAKLEEEKLKATIEALEKEKSEMNARVVLMERKDLYDLLEAKMAGF
ncbi:hypothetical protein R1flu_000907 [Riccia fluitans]|uniref:Uncharacterized protein n=1 Tax=Riccia fluitans TaxID=41844 RepID=A0ABD1Y4Y8_9MARC